MQCWVLLHPLPDLPHRRAVDELYTVALVIQKAESCVVPESGDVDTQMSSTCGQSGVTGTCAQH